jgi:hypothetical protein
LKAVREDENVHPGRLRIEIGGEVMAVDSGRRSQVRKPSNEAMCVQTK